MSTLRRRVKAIGRGARRMRRLAKLARRIGLLDGVRPAGLRALVKSRLKPSPTTVLRFHAANQPDHVALAYRDRRYTYAELDGEMDRVAAALQAEGLGAGDAALLMLENVPEFLILQGALGRIGATAVNVSWHSTARELRYLATHSGARALFFAPRKAEVAAEVAAEVKAIESLVAVGGSCDGHRSYAQLIAQASANGVCERTGEASVVIYTSGTTGHPKGAVRRFDSRGGQVFLNFFDETGMRAGQTHLAVCPLYHTTAFGFIQLSYVLGSKVVLLDGFEPESFLAAIEEHRVNHVAVVPTMLHRLVALRPDVRARYDTSSLQAIFTGGAVLSAELAARVKDCFGEVLYNLYGSTETGVVTVATPAELCEAPGTIGHAVGGNTIEIVKEDGTLASVGETGELFVRNGNVFSGYHDDPEATARSTRGEFFSVGDIAYRDAEGRYFLQGRKHDMIISGGVNVYPREIETVLSAHPAVDEVAVIGLPDADWGERVCAFVTLHSSATSAELIAHCRAELSGPKQPKEITIMDALPRNPTGKVLRRQLREMAPA